MKIRVRTMNNKTLHCSCSPNDTVLDLKLKLQNESGFPVSEQRLVFGARTLRDQQSLMECGIKEDCTLMLVLRLTGGGCSLGVGFNFASMESGSKRGFSETAPNYRFIAPGFNLEGRCMNKNCEAFNRLAWSTHGFSRTLQEVDSLFDTGGFNIGFLLHNSPCPLCKKSMDPDSVVSCGFYLCRYSYEGYQKGKTSVIKGSGEARAWDGFEYHNGVMDSKTWTTLVIVVKPL